MEFKKITFIGGGNMAKSLINGLIRAKFPSNNITVCTPHPEKVAALKEEFKINGTTDNAQGCMDAEVIILAIKPQVAATALAPISAAISDFSNKIIISVMAGITIERITKLLPGAKKVVRVMPNTPCLIGYGLSGAFASGLNQEEKDFTNNLLSSCGHAIWLDSEDKINDITALSGSAPAYFFLFLECMSEKAKEYGFSEDNARYILQNVALGSAMMVLENQDKTLKQLREEVTSKGGTTAKALDVFNNHDLTNIVSEALDACKNRAVEMAKQF